MLGRVGFKQELAIWHEMVVSFGKKFFDDSETVIFGEESLCGLVRQSFFV